MSQNIGPNSSKPIFQSSIDNCATKCAPPFMQAFGMCKLLEGANISALFNIQSVSLANTIQLDKLKLIPDKPPSILGKGKGG